MRTFKIYGENYPLANSTDQVPDAYGFRNEILDDKPKGKLVGYVTMQDGSIIECYTALNPIVVVAPIAGLVVIVGAIYAFIMIGQPKDVKLNDTVVKQGTDKNVVSYNGFMAIHDGQLSVNFKNGDQVATVAVVGDGISCEPFTVQPGEVVTYIPATFKTDKGLIPSKITITTNTSAEEQEVMVEIPENNTANSPQEGLEGYWKGEYVYGTAAVPSTESP